LPPGFCDVIAAMMDKNPDKRTPTASAVVELLRPWRDENATKHLAEASPPGSGIFIRGGAPQPPTSAALDETASYVLDDLDFPPGQVESPSQISQGTVSVSSETEDTLAGVPALRRSAPVVRTTPLPAETAPPWSPKIFVAAGIVAVLVGSAVAAWWLGLFR
jgi:hypothetical protein